jgi:hypothetical protein
LSVITPFPHPRDRRSVTSFDRAELQRIPEVAVFAAFRRTTERPEVRIEKRPQLQLKQGAYALVSEHGLVLKRGHELHGILAPIERRLMRLVRE